MALRVRRRRLRFHIHDASRDALWIHVNWLVIADLFMLLFLGVADNQMIAALLPVLGNAFNKSVEIAGLLVVVYSLAAAFAAFLSGPLSDLYGRRGFLLTGGAVFAVASWLSWRVENFPQLLATRALTGLAAGIISTCSFAFAGDWFAYSVRGRALGLISAAYFAAPIVGVPLAGQIADRYGWRRVFLLFAIAGLVVTALSLAIPRLPGEVRRSNGRLRSALSTFGSFIAKRDLAAALAAAFLVSAGLVGFITYIGQWLHDRFGLATRSITLVFMVGGLASLIGAPLGGILSDRWGKRAVSIASNIFLAVAVATIPLFGWGTTLLVVFGLTGLGAAFRQGPLTALMTEMVPAAQRGSFMALRNISSQLGIGAVALAGGVLYLHDGYLAVTTLCSAMTALVAVLLLAFIAEPRR